MKSSFGVQAAGQGGAGTWKDLTHDTSTSMAGNSLTSQVARHRARRHGVRERLPSTQLTSRRAAEIAELRRHINT